MADEEDVGVSIRHQKQHERMQRIRESRRVPRVRVLPRDDDVRKHIAHYPTGVGFPAEGSVEWPYDNFTKRRIRDGAVTIDTQTGEQRDALRAKPERLEPPPA
jgi:hypothetical protein